MLFFAYCSFIMLANCITNCPLFTFFYTNCVHCCILHGCKKNVCNKRNNNNLGQANYNHSLVSVGSGRAVCAII